MTDTARWTPDFDFYEAQLAPSVVGSLFVDLAAHDHAPLATHPVRMAVRVKMLAPREDGLRSNDEADALFELEDHLSANVKVALDGVFVGRVVAQGYASFVFYLPGESVALAEDLTRVTGSGAPYRLEWNLDDDPAWDFYREMLYPEPRALAGIMSRRAADRALGR